MNHDTKHQKPLKLNRETIKKLDQDALSKVIGGGGPLRGPAPQKIGE